MIVYQYWTYFLQVDVGHISGSFDMFITAWPIFIIGPNYFIAIVFFFSKSFA
jgi:hypothetical protein